MPHKLGAIVNDVAAKTGAANLGLKKGDIITRYNGDKVTFERFSDLTTTLASNDQQVKICWLFENTQACDDLTLTSRLQPVLEEMQEKQGD
jgi:S1-C subfamily serine protease